MLNQLEDLQPEEMKQFFRDQEVFVNKTRAKKLNDDHVFHAFLLHLQLNGLRNQYNSMQSKETQIEDIDFYMINAFGDIFNLDFKFNPVDFSKMTLAELKHHFTVNTHCKSYLRLKKLLAQGKI